MDIKSDNFYEVKQPFSRLLHQPQPLFNIEVANIFVALGQSQLEKFEFYVQKLEF